MSDDRPGTCRAGGHPMKIVFLIQRPQRRGAELFALQLGSELMDRGHEVTVIALFRGPSQLEFPGRLITLDRPEIFRFFDVPGWLKLSRFLRKAGTELVMANAGDTLKFAIGSRMMGPWKARLVFRNASVMGRYLTRWYHGPYNRFLMKRVDQVISVSSDSLRDLCRHFPWLTSRSVVIPVGISVGTEPALPVTARSRMIVQAGAFTFEKNQAAMIRIFTRLAAQDKAVMLCFLGDGPMLRDMRQLAEHCGYTDRIRFMGNVADIRPWLQQASALAVTSIIEGLPAVVLEAMECGCPVVSFAVGGVGDAIVDGKTGVLIAPGEEAAFAETLVRLLNDGEWRASLAARAQETVRTAFTIGAVATSFEQTFLKLTDLPK